MRGGVRFGVSGNCTGQKMPDGFNEFLDSLLHDTRFSFFRMASSLEPFSDSNKNCDVTPRF